MGGPTISPFWIWLIGIIDNIKLAAFIAAFISFFLVAIGFGGLLMETDKNAQKTGKKLLLIFLPYLLIAASIAFFAPNSKTLVTMIAVNEGLEVTEQKLKLLLEGTEQCK